MDPSCRQLVQLRLQDADVQTRLAAMETQLEAMERSFSWKITASVRFLSRRFPFVRQMMQRHSMTETRSWNLHHDPARGVGPEPEQASLGPETYRTVSVIVPNFNYARYLAERVASIQAQTYPVHEIILLDDASTDDSVLVMENLRSRLGKQIQMSLNTSNSGAVARQWARGVGLATGDLVWIAEADDLADSNFLAATVRAFDDPDVVLSYSQSRRIDSSGNTIWRDYSDYLDDVDPQRWRHDYCRRGVEEIADALSVRNTIPNISAVVFRRAAVADLLAAHLDELSTLRIAADWCFYIRLLREGSVAYVSQTLSSHRQHPQSITTKIDGFRHLEEIQQMQRLASQVVEIPIDKVIAGRLWWAACAEMAISDLQG